LRLRMGVGPGGPDRTLVVTFPKDFEKQTAGASSSPPAAIDECGIRYA
jgi:hypothetical protein